MTSAEDLHCFIVLSLILPRRTKESGGQFAEANEAAAKIDAALLRRPV